MQSEFPSWIFQRSSKNKWKKDTKNHFGFYSYSYMYRITICYMFQFQVNCNISRSNHERCENVVRKVVCCLKWNFSSGIFSLMHSSDGITNPLLFFVYILIHLKYVSTEIAPKKSLRKMSIYRIVTKFQPTKRESIIIHFQYIFHSIENPFDEKLYNLFYRYLSNKYEIIYILIMILLNISVHFAHGARNHISHSWWWSKK